MEAEGKVRERANGIRSKTDERGNIEGQEKEQKNRSEREGKEGEKESVN